MHRHPISLLIVEYDDAITGYYLLKRWTMFTLYLGNLNMPYTNGREILTAW
ncbi:hypothetical protein [Alteromonas oceanisediminis]|uniref:hypothetical protein n=1 Tax=Alteromonas oceanisediminis TaxID=2836180 RepID=UPI001BDB0D48|nr:hypothetical protein [Alteromonas oceanisediminis]MBT0587301.1 hypothetical protein [Alteromonas oceanisediminis]